MRKISREIIMFAFIDRNFTVKFSSGKMQMKVYLYVQRCSAVEKFTAMKEIMFLKESECITLIII